MLDYIVPIIAAAMIQNFVSTAPELTTTPTEIYGDSISVEVNGKRGSHVYVNGVEVAIIEADGNVIIDLNTSGMSGTKDFEITLHDNADHISATLNLSLEKLLTTTEAKKFLSITTFGATKDSIETLKTEGIENWVNNQLALPYVPNSHLRRTIEMAKEKFPDNYPAEVEEYIVDNDVVFEGSGRVYIDQMSAWFSAALLDEDQLRHRMAYALSQIVVESTAEPIFVRRAEALASYFDIVTKNAFGNYRDLLIEISHSSSMSLYLTYHGSKKEQTINEGTISETTIFPDENYAREIMQLFTIGLSELNLDGTEKLDSNGNSVPTYTQTDVNEIAKVFTGWDMQRNPKFGKSGEEKPGDLSHPLECTDIHHDFRAKSVLGSTIDADNSCSEDIAALVDILMAHENMAPFISKQLIMRLAKSNPTPAYVARVATVFNNNAEGVKGDLKAVVKAILLDSELWEIEGTKKFKEPLLAYTEFLRAFGVKNLPIWNYNNSGNYIEDKVYFCVAPTDYLGQGAARAYTVFNFYDNHYIPNDTEFKNANLYAPELQIQSDNIFVEFSNKIIEDLTNQEKNYLLNKFGTLTDIETLKNERLFYNKNKDKFLIDCTDEYNVMEIALAEESIDAKFNSFNRVDRTDDPTADADGVTNRDRALKALIEELDTKLLVTGLSVENKNLLFDTYKDLFYLDRIIKAGNPTVNIYQIIIIPIIVAIVTSENFMVQE